MRPAVRTLAGALGCVAAVACTEDPGAPRPGDTYPVVHAVLNPLASDQIVLVEQALVGRVATALGDHDPLEPILTGGGHPVSFAYVAVTGPTREMVLRERSTFRPGDSLPQFLADGRGAGYYFFVNSPKPDRLPPAPDIFMQLMPGATYTLEIRWPDASRDVRGTTTIPRHVPIPFEPARTLNRDRDTVVIPLPGPAAAVQAARYLLLVSTPFGPMSFYTDSAVARLSGDLVSIDLPGAPPAFVPGFRQRVDVAAVDVNYYDYHRSRTNTRAGTVRIDNLSGAAGVFGAYLPLGSRVVDVVADQEEPHEGVFVRTGAPNDTLWLYAHAGGIAGRASGFPPAHRGNLLGSHRDGRLQLALVSFSRIADTLATFTGTLQGTTISGRYSDEAGTSTFERLTTAAAGAP